MKEATIVDAATGVAKSVIMAPADQIAANLSEGQVAIDGVVPRGKRYDPASKSLVDYRPPPPQPAVDYEWHDTASVWQLKAEVATKRESVVTAKAEIARLEAKSHRAGRELLLNPDDVQARGRVVEIERAMEAQREIIRVNETIEADR